ncbi:hypothetical protein [Sphingomonas soli]|uniref:hypothetical protein n=1 Tax=Sphingomonas soli TaxID=266127 RepID=UPI00083010ED|nr:hypothetical protein [Sphingomonas soli]
MATYRRSILFRLAADPIAWIWSGHGDLPVEADAIDPGGATYVGAGALLDIPALKQLVNGTADRLDFVLSGVSGYTLRLAQEDAASIPNALVLIGEQDFDADWQNDGPPRWVWRGFADILVTESQDVPNGRQRTIRLSVRSADTFRSNPQPAFYTDQDVRRKSPSDAIASHVSLITAGAKRRFGPSSK